MAKHQPIRITPYQAEKHEQLVAIWLRAVEQTHHFLATEDIAFYHRLVRQEALTAVELWMALDETEQPLGFIGLEASNVSMLFVDPSWHGHGIGRQLLSFAVQQKGDLTLDVNEQNPQAVRFYERYGFERIGRSERDGSGRPFPLLHYQLRVHQTNAD